MHVCVLGAGSLSLGLLCPWLRRLPHIELSLVTRASPSADALLASGGYRLSGSEERVDLGAVFPRGVFVYDPSDLTNDAAAQCLSLLGGADVAVVSVGVPNLPAVAALIAQACEWGEPGPPLHLLAFENSHDASLHLYKHVDDHRHRLGGRRRRRAIVAHRAIPDRACSRLMNGNEIVIRVESFSEIVLESTADDLFKVSSETASAEPRVHLVEPDLIYLAEMRKFWLVNGTHTALGLFCHAARRQLLLDGLEVPEIRAFMEELHREWVRVLHRWALTAVRRGEENELFSEQSLAAHASALFDRLQDLPDFSVLNVLKELRGLEENGTASEQAMLRLLEKLDDRLGHQVRAAQTKGKVPVPASAWMLASGLHTVRSHADAYWRH